MRGIMAEDKKAKKDDKSKFDKIKDARSVVKEADAPEDTEMTEGTEVSSASLEFTPKKIILFVILPLLLIIGSGMGLYRMGFLDKVIPGKHLSCENVQEGDKDFDACNALAANDGKTPGAFLDVPNIIVNLNSTTKQPRFLKISIKIELDNPEEQQKIAPLLPRVIDQFQMYLRELRIEDLRGTSGVYRMKIELLSRVRAAAPNIKVRDVLFQEILVQ